MSLLFVRLCACFGWYCSYRTPNEPRDMQSEARCAFIDTDTSWILREVFSPAWPLAKWHCWGRGTKRILFHFVKQKQGKDRYYRKFDTDRTAFGLGHEQIVLVRIASHFILHVYRKAAYTNKPTLPHFTPTTSSHIGIRLVAYICELQPGVTTVQLLLSIFDVGSWIHGQNKKHTWAATMTLVSTKNECRCCKANT